MLKVPEDYLRWFHETNVWKSMHWRGVRTLKLPLDMWNYQEIFTDHGIQWIVEAGTRHGGSALYFADYLDAIDAAGQVITVDITHDALDPRIIENPRISLLLGDSGDSSIVSKIHEFLPEHDRGPVFMILDSDHAADHVFRELHNLVPILKAGDYLVVEDTIVNGHPVRPNHGPGPWEALDIYLADHSNELQLDHIRESKFGCSFAARGYFIKT